MIPRAWDRDGIDRLFSIQEMTMSFSKLEKPKTLAVTRQLVNEFLNMEALPRDRPLSERRLAFYPAGDVGLGLL
jgi:hypothetical protein